MKIGEAFVEVRAKTDKFEQQVTASGGRAGKGVASSLGNAVTGALAGGAAVKVLSDAFNAATDLNEAISLTGVVFKGQAAGIREFGETSAESVGLAESEALSFANTIGGLFIGMGTSRKEAARLSEEIVTLGADLASAKNLTGGTAEALEILRSGLVGEVEPLRRVGVALNAARVEQQALADTGKTSAAALTEGEKAAARYALIVEDLGAQGVVGDFQRTAQGAANQQRILSAEWKNTQATLGQALTPAVMELMDAVKEAMPVIEDMGPALANTANEIGGVVATGAGLVSWLKDVGDFAGPAADALMSLTENLNPIGAARNVWEGAGDIVDSVTQNWVTGSGLAEDAMGGLVTGTEAAGYAVAAAAQANITLATSLDPVAAEAQQAADAVADLEAAWSGLNNLLTDEEALIQARQALRELQEAAIGALEGGVNAAEMDDLRLSTIGYAQSLQAAAEAANTNARGVLNSRAANRDLLASMQLVRNEIPQQLIPMWDRMIRELGRPARLNADGQPARREIENTTQQGERYGHQRFVAEFDGDPSGAQQANAAARRYGDDWEGRVYTAHFDARMAGGIPGQASGGPVGAGDVYMVGERGPELFVSDRAGRILNNGETGRALNGGGHGAGWGGGGNMVNVNVPGLVTAEVIERVVVPRVMMELDRAERRRGY